MCNNYNRCGSDLKFLLEQPEVLTYMSDIRLATDKQIFQNGALRKVSAISHYN